MVESNPGLMGELRGDTSKGLALTGTTQHFRLKSARYLTLTPRNFASSGVVARLAINPYLIVLKTADALSTAPTDYSVEAQDGDAGTDVTLSSLSTAANLDYVYLGAERPFRGVKVDGDALNGNASVLTGYYWNGTAWANISLTDGSDNAGATFGVDGDITWTIPTGWRKTSLLECGDSKCVFKHAGTPLYWVRLQVSAALDASVTLNSVMPLAPSTEYFELIENQSFVVAIERGDAGSIEAAMDTGTGNLVVNYGRAAGSNF